MKKIVLVLVLLIILISIVFLKEETVYLQAKYARDSDGTDAGDILKNINDGYEILSLKANPYGYVEISNFNFSGVPKKAYAIFEWNAYEDLGASNIYIGYSFGDVYKETGPLEAKGNRKIEIPVNIFTDFSKLKIRFRGEDSDFGPDALVEVKMKLEVVKWRFAFVS